ncbi:methyl-accepting chemotaxis protein [Halobiforma lacisalsi AJ5]|uniref:Chemotaxis sensory transducer n=1 Tax=Natronobacterium lacisalsi AJ5 TaxID=358396 RepID=M0LP56_NATLA|nr:methyl-accepting chemotaxis protein [Halobiforma lacisalsi]APW96859.1 methyl-accepting chemotaxis protein [Halobiforma lacisalsi AJ5]EMA34888.1 chemotaxis sensory transducer [Halobiforma lacisalsi AJ5]
MGPDPWALVPVIRRRYALRFTIALIVVVLVVGAFGGVIYAHTGNELQTDVQEQLVTDAETDADRLGTWLESSERYVESITRSSVFRNDDRFAITGSLNRLADRPGFEGAYYVDSRTGSVDTHAGTDEIVEDGQLRVDVDERISSTTDGTSEVAFSDPFETGAGRPVLLTVSEVPGDSDHVVVGLVDLEALSEYVLGSDETGNVSVADSTGTLVLADDPSLLLTTADLESIDPGDGSDTVTVDTDAGRAVVGYAPVEEKGWTLTTRVPTGEAYSLQSDVSNQILAMLGVVFFGMLALGATIGRNTARSLRTLSERATAIEGGDLETPVESDRRDELGELHRSLDRMRRSLRDRLEEAERARTEAERERERAESARAEAERAREKAERATAESEAFSRQLERTADDYGEAMRACADGDLTRRLEPDAESEAMATVACEFNAMMDDIEETVAASRAFADAVDEAAESTVDGVVEVETAAERVATSVQEISDGAERQSEHLAAVGSEIEDLSTTTEEIAVTASNVATLAERTASTTASARESAQRAIEGMDTIAADADDAVAEVDRLEDEIAAIDDLLEFIREVAQQTNMLALNANIEAARSRSSGSAGSSVSGFTTVAEEIKALAEDTEDAAADVESRLEAVRAQTDRVVAVVRETDERIGTHRDAVESSLSSLEEISTHAERTNEGIQEISAATQQQAAAAREVATKVEDVTAISDRTSAESETVAAAAEEQTASLGAVSGTATSLSERADELSSVLSSFTVAAERAGEETSPAEDTTRTGDGDGGDPLEAELIGDGDGGDENSGPTEESPPASPPASR